MKRSGIFRVVAVFHACTLILSCASGIPEERLLSGSPQNQYGSRETRIRVASLFSETQDRGNILIHHSAGLSLPENWRFLLSPSEVEGQTGIPTESEDTDNILFRFTSPRKEIRGLCAVMEIDEAITVDEAGIKRIAYLYEEALPEDYVIYRTIKTQTEKFPAVLVHGEQKEKERLFVSLLLPEGKEIYAVEVTGPSEEIAGRAELLSEILHSFALADSAFSYRNIGGALNDPDDSGLCFHGFASPWRWYGDNERGFSLYGTVNNIPTAVSFLPVEEERQNLEEFFPRGSPGGSPNRTEIEYIINNVERKTEAYIDTAGEDTGAAVFSFLEGKTPYVVVIRSKGVGTAEKMQEILTSESLYSLFENNIRF